jgi:hypothetical protein
VAEEGIFIWNRHNTILNFIILLKTVVFFFFLEKLDAGIMLVICGIEPDNDYCLFVLQASEAQTSGLTPSWLRGLTNATRSYRFGISSLSDS